MGFGGGSRGRVPGGDGAQAELSAQTVPECLPSSCQLAKRMRRTSAVRPVALPRGPGRVRPGNRCTVAGWGLLGLNRRTNKLHEVQLTVQRDSRCSNRFRFYDSQTQICVGNPGQRKSAFMVRPRAAASTARHRGRGRLGSRNKFYPHGHPHPHSLVGSEQSEVGAFPIHPVPRGTGEGAGTQHIHVQGFPAKGEGMLTWVE